MLMPVLAFALSRRKLLTVGEALRSCFRVRTAFHQNFMELQAIQFSSFAKDECRIGLSQRPRNQALTL